MDNNKKLTDEDKRKNFVKYSNIRLKNALRAINLLGNLANTRAYSYDSKDINIIKSELHKGIKEMEAAFTSKSKNSLERNFIK